MWSIDLLSAAPHHLPALKDLVREYLLLPDAWGQHGPPVELPVVLEQELLALPQLAVPPVGDAALCREHHDEPFGAALLVPFDENRAEIKRLYVRPEGWRRGAGRALVSTLMDVARTLGYRDVLVDVVPQRLAAVRLYERLGFVQTEPFRQYEVHEMVFLRHPV